MERMVTLEELTGRELMLIAAGLSTLSALLIGMDDTAGAVEVLDLQRKFTGTQGAR